MLLVSYCAAYPLNLTERSMKGESCYPNSDHMACGLFLKLAAFRDWIIHRHFQRMYNLVPLSGMLELKSAVLSYNYILTPGSMVKA